MPRMRTLRSVPIAPRNTKPIRPSAPYAVGFACSEPRPAWWYPLTQRPMSSDGDWSNSASPPTAGMVPVRRSRDPSRRTTMTIPHATSDTRALPERMVWASSRPAPAIEVSRSSPDPRWPRKTPAIWALPRTWRRRISLSGTRRIVRSSRRRRRIAPEVAQVPGPRRDDVAGVAQPSEQHRVEGLEDRQHRGLGDDAQPVAAAVAGEHGAQAVAEQQATAVGRVAALVERHAVGDRRGRARPARGHRRCGRANRSRGPRRGSRCRDRSRGASRTGRRAPGGRRRGR